MAKPIAITLNMYFPGIKPKRLNGRLEVCYTNQNLGRKIGSVDVQCTFNAKESRWTTKDGTELHGLLLFNIQFADRSKVPLRSAIITIDVGKFNRDNARFIIDEAAPANGITGAPVEQPISKKKGIDPDIEVSAAGGGAKAKGFSIEEETKVTDVHRWIFKAGLPSQKQQTRIHKADFTWTRTLLQDRKGTQRSYEGALIVNRSTEHTTPLELDVRVEVEPWHWWHSIWNGGSRHRRSEPIGPSTKSLTSSEALVPLDYNNLEHYIISRNSKLALTRKSTLPSSSAWSTKAYKNQRSTASTRIADLKTSCVNIPNIPLWLRAPRRKI